MKRLAALGLLGSLLACNGSVDDLAVTSEVAGGGANASAAPGSAGSEASGSESADRSAVSDAAGDEATMPAVHFVITGDDGAAWPVGGDGGFLAYGRLAIERFLHDGAGKRMAVGLTLHPRWPERRACATDADCGSTQCSNSVPKLAPSTCCDDDVGCHPCAAETGLGVGVCPGTMQVCTGGADPDEIIAGRVMATCDACDLTPRCMASPFCAREEYGRPDVALAPAARSGAAVVTALRAFAPGGGGAMEGAYVAATSHASRYASSHPRAPVAIVVIDAGDYASTPCYSPASRLAETAASVFGEDHVRTFTITLGDDFALGGVATAGGGFSQKLGRYTQSPLADRLDAALARVAVALEGPR